MALGEPLSVFGICPYLMESIKRKIKKKEDIYVLLFDESLIQQLKKKTAGHPSYTRIKL